MILDKEAFWGQGNFRRGLAAKGFPAAFLAAGVTSTSLKRDLGRTSQCQLQPFPCATWESQFIHIL